MPGRGRGGRGARGARLFLEDELHEGGVQVVSDVLVLLLLGHQLVCTLHYRLYSSNKLDYITFVPFALFNPVGTPSQVVKPV